MRRTFIAFALAAMTALPAAAATVTSGPATFESKLGEVRYKGLERGNTNIYLGEDGLGSTGVRSEAAVRYAEGANDFTFTFDAALGKLQTMIGGKTLSYDLGSSFASANQLEINIRNNARKSGGNIALTNFVVNGESVADSFFATPNPENKLFTVGDFGVKNLLTITGTLLSIGLANGFDGENAKINIKAGVAPVAAVPLPAALPLLGAGLAALAFAGRRRRKAA